MRLDGNYMGEEQYLFERVLRRVVKETRHAGGRQMEHTSMLQGLHICDIEENEDIALVLLLAAVI